MSFLISKYKGIYRLQTEYDQSTKQFPRNLSGTFEDSDIYIKCKHDVRIYHYGKGLLEAYIPSIQRGMNIIRTIYRDYINKSNTETTITYMTRGNKLIERENIKIIDEQLFYSQLKDGVISNFYKTDSEILFRFHYKYMKEFEKYFQPQTSGANTSPFSSKNLPKLKYDIPLKELEEYKSIIDSIPQKDKLTIAYYTREFIDSEIAKNKQYRTENIRDVMKRKMLKGKEFIHSEGYWNQYICYLKKKIGDNKWKN